MENCLFCKIAEGTIPSKKVYEDEQVLAFYDINEQAPVHVLLIPKKHIESVMEVEREDDALICHLVHVAQNLALQLGLSENGFRLVLNTGAYGGQTMMHMHIHILGGRYMSWPPG